jgi:hypothetical protein
VCGVQPKPVWDDGHWPHQPFEATMFEAGMGHYGSTVWDKVSGDQSLMINVCDSCLLERRDRAAVVNKVRVPTEFQFEPWQPEP